MQKIVSLIVGLLILGCSNNLTSKTELPAHYGKGEFVNPYLKEDRSFWDVIKMRYFDEEWISWDDQENKVPVQKPDFNLINSYITQPKVTWIGHSTFLIQINKINILTDPVFSEIISPVSFIGPKRVHPPGIALKDLPAIDYVLISHNHYDHLNVDFVKWMGNKTIWIVPLGLKEFLLDFEIKSQNIVELDWYENFHNQTISITATPAQHFSGRWLNDRNETLWCSFAVKISNFTFWFGGDTGYNDIQFKEIGNKYGAFDFALIPIGANRPRWFMKAVHVNPEEAVIIHREIKSKYSIGMHWGTFRQSAEAIDEPVLELRKAITKHNLKENEFVTLKIGETKIINPDD